MARQKFTVNNRVYEVEIVDINARPVVVYVDGQRFEVMPGEQDQVETRNEVGERKETRAFEPNPSSLVSPSPNSAMSGNTLTSPLPGTVVNIFVKPGDKVEAGQVVLVIEAMKMRNNIRSPYSGTIREVLANEGESVAHKQALIKFADLGEASWT